MGKPIRVLLVDDHGVLRAGLRSLLDAESDIEVIGEAAWPANGRSFSIPPVEERGLAKPALEGFEYTLEGQGPLAVIGQALHRLGRRDPQEAQDVRDLVRPLGEQREPPVERQR